MVKSRYIGDGHPTFNRNPYNWYIKHIKPYYWVDEFIPYYMEMSWELIDPIAHINWLAGFLNHQQKSLPWSHVPKLNPFRVQLWPALSNASKVSRRSWRNRCRRSWNFKGQRASWWLNQPCWNICCSSNWIIFPRIGMKTKNSWVATT